MKLWSWQHSAAYAVVDIGERAFGGLGERPACARVASLAGKLKRPSARILDQGHARSVAASNRDAQRELNEFGL